MNMKVRGIFVLFFWSTKTPGIFVLQNRVRKCSVKPDS
jgi:hypothetical protein